jgi:UDP-glucose 4-epimerase
MSDTLLVTGGAGFIGSSIARAALERGDTVRVIDDLSTGRRENLTGLDVELFETSILDDATLRRAMRGCRTVFHLAGQVSVPRSLEDPELTHAVNATGSMAVYEAARDAGVTRVVYSASCAAYGQAATLPIHETTPLSPESPYAASKLVGELYGSAWSASMDLEVASLRYFNVYGPRQNPEGGYAAAIPAFITRLLQGDPITIFGDGEQTRDFVFIDDVVRANLMAANAPAASGQVVNIGSGKRISVNTLVETLQTLITSGTVVTHGPGRHGEVRHSVADTQAAKDLLNFSAQVPLVEGLARTVAWYREDS